MTTDNPWTRQPGTGTGSAAPPPRQSPAVHSDRSGRVAGDWEAYRAGLMDLTAVLDAADEETTQHTRTIEDQVHAAREHLGQAEAERDELAGQLATLEQHARTTLDAAGVVADGAGTGAILVEVTDTHAVRTAITEIRHDLTRTAEALAAARHLEAERRARWSTAGIVAAASLAAYALLTWLNATAFAALGAALTVCIAGLVARRGGLAPTIITTVSAIAGTAVLWTTTHPVVASVFLPATGLIGVVVLTRTRHARRTRQPYGVPPPAG